MLVTSKPLALASGILWKDCSMRVERHFHVTSFDGEPAPCSHATQRHPISKGVESWRVASALVCVLDGAIVGAICMDCLDEAAQS
jgi:hypothetical protein